MAHHAIDDLTYLWGYRWVRTLVALAACAGLVWLAMRLSGVLVPVMLGLAIAYLLNPLVERLERWKLPRTLAVVLIVVVAGCVLAGVVFLVVPLLVQQLVDLAVLLPAYAQSLRVRLDTWIESLRIGHPEAYQQTLAWLEEKASALDWSRILAPVWGFFLRFFSNLWGIFLRVFQVTLVPVFAVYFLHDYPKIKGLLAGLVPPHHREPIFDRLRQVDRALSSVVRGQVTVSCIMAVLYTIGLAILGTPMWLLLGILSGLGNLIPYLGTTLGITLSVIFTLLGGGSLSSLLGIAAVFGIVQFLEGWVLTPRLVGRGAGLHPVVVIIVLLAAGSLFGLLGLLLALPVAATVRVFASDLIGAYRRTAFYSGDGVPPATP